MKEHLSAAAVWVERIIKGFNVAFFAVSVILWVYFTVVNIMAAGAFRFELLWSAFNTMYADLSFKVSCILLIVFNGMDTLRGFLGQYMDLKEKLEHANAIRKVLAGKK
jgi:hypothetical protein